MCDIDKFVFKIDFFPFFFSFLRNLDRFIIFFWKLFPFRRGNFWVKYVLLYKTLFLAQPIDFMKIFVHFNKIDIIFI